MYKSKEVNTINIIRKIKKKKFELSGFDPKKHSSI